MLESNCHHSDQHYISQHNQPTKSKRIIGKANNCALLMTTTNSGGNIDNNSFKSSSSSYSSMFNFITTTTTTTTTNYNQKSPVMKTLASSLLLTIIIIVSIGSSNQQSTNQFDASNYKDVYSAVKAHPRLREFAKLLELDGVRPLAANDQTELTIFAPVDDAMEDLIQKAKSRSFNLADVAKHHIVAEAVIADENTKYPISIQSATRSSPLFLTQPQYQEEGLFKYQQANNGKSASSSSSSSSPMAPIFVNNAKIVETYVLQNGDSVLQVLHVIDHLLERLSITQRTSIRTQNVQAVSSVDSSSLASQAAALTSMGQKQLANNDASNNNGDNSGSQQSLKATGSTAAKWKTEYKQAQIKKPVNLDNVLANQQVLYDFYEKYSDLTTRNNQLNKLHTRTYSDAQLSSEYRLERDEFDLERLIRALKQHPQLFGLLYNVSEGNQNNNQTNQYNTYFLPIPTQSRLFDEDFAKNLQVIRAHVIPNEVLFTRTMGLGRPHQTLVRTGQDQVTLNLAKTVQMSNSNNNNNNNYQQTTQSPLGMPLFVQSSYQHESSASQNNAPSDLGDSVPRGIVNSEIIVANIPLTSGVLHLIRKPLVVSDVALTEYLNDHDHQLSHLLGASGTLTRGVAPYNLLLENNNQLDVPKVSKFRELLAKDHQLYAELSSATQKTILVPSDEAFESIRYDLRALINQDEQLIPSTWDSDRRNEIVSSLLKKHIIMHNRITTTSEYIHEQPSTSGSDPSLSIKDNNTPVYYNANGQQVEFFVNNNNDASHSDNNNNNNAQYVVVCDSTRANILHRNLAGINGVIHIIDRVLGEEPETVYSLLKSIVLKYAPSVESRNYAGDINQLIESNMNNKQRMQPSALTTQQYHDQQLGGRISKEQFITLSSDEPNNNLDQQQTAGQQQQQQQQKVDEPKLIVISETIKQYLEDPQNVKQLESLAKSVNISYQLAKSSKDGSDDWNERFKQQDKLFTYFVPSDLAWLKLQQRQPRLHEPLMSALAELDQQAARGQSVQQQQQQQQSSAQDTASSSPPSTELVPSGTGNERVGESSQRLRQILERHVVMNKKITKKELDQLNSLQTMRATLRVSDKATNQQATVTSLEHDLTNYNRGVRNDLAQESGRVLLWESNSASIVTSNEAINGAVHIIDNVMVVDSDFQTSPLSSSSSLLSSSNPASIFYLKSISPMQNLILLSCSLVIMIIVCSLLVRHCFILAKGANKKKMTEDEEEDQSTSGPLTSAHSNTTGSTSTTKSL